VISRLQQAEIARKTATPSDIQLSAVHEEVVSCQIAWSSKQPV
jgi:hypothetical protein